MEKQKDKKKEKKKVNKYNVSLYKEMEWLEEMAMKGWFLENIKFNMTYIFAKGEPKRMLYESDCFYLPKKPTLEEIHHKETFLEMAEQLGWRKVTHNSNGSYYFCKEYVKGDINELYNDEESRRYRAHKFSTYYEKKAKEFNYILLVMALMFFVLKLIQLDVNMGMYDLFVIFYVMLCCIMSIAHHKVARLHGKELGISRQEWREKRAPGKYKQTTKLLLTMKGLDKYLQSQAQEGWILTEVSTFRFSFEKSKVEQQIYMMDSKWLTNKRRKSRQEKALEDKKDWAGMNNDWQLSSVKEAKEKGWTFVCALENRAIIYRGNKEETIPMHDEKYGRGIRGTSLIGEYALFLIKAGFAGGCVGLIGGYLAGKFLI